MVARSFRVGIVGAGLMGSRMGARLQGPELPEASVAGVTDVDAARAAALGDTLGVPPLPSLEALVEATAPDALYLATPDARHLEPALAAVRCGVPFLVEKPLATTVADALAIERAAREAGVHAEVNFSNRWNPPFAAARERVDAGGIGAPVSLLARLNNTIRSPLENLAWAADTSPAWFLMSHALDLAHWLTGNRVDSVFATGHRGVLERRGVPTWDSIQALVRYADGSHGCFESVWVLPAGLPAPVEFTFRLVGEAGALTVDTSQQGIELVTGERTEHPGTLNWAAARLRAFLHGLDGGPVGVPLAAGVEVTRVLVAIHESLESGASVVPAKAV